MPVADGEEEAATGDGGKPVEAFLALSDQVVQAVSKTYCWS
jgi:hypothetical protein